MSDCIDDRIEGNFVFLAVFASADLSNCSKAAAPGGSRSAWTVRRACAPPWTSIGT